MIVHCLGGCHMMIPVVHDINLISPTKPGKELKYSGLLLFERFVSPKWLSGVYIVRQKSFFFPAKTTGYQFDYTLDIQTPA